MAKAPAPGPATLEHRHLRSALEFAVEVARVAQQRRREVGAPAALNAFFNLERIPSSALGRIRRAIDNDDGFRERLAAELDEAAAAGGGAVDAIGREWLQRTAGWSERIAELIASADDAEEQKRAAAELKREQKRRQRAEEKAERSQRQADELRVTVEQLRAELASARSARRSGGASVEGLRTELAVRERKLATADERIVELTAAADADRQALIAAEERALLAERQRDELLATRAAAGGQPIAAEKFVELRALAAVAAKQAERLAALVAVDAPTRQPVALPGAATGQPAKAADFLLRVPSVIVFIDGYNVSKLRWPDDELAIQRQRLLDVADELARRYGAELVVVFDGADVTGAHTTRRRLARVRYSPADTIADDVIRSEVAAVDPQRPVVVVTNDKAIRRDVTVAGANVVSSEAFVALAR